MGFKFEGDTDNLNDVQLNFVSGVLEKRGFKDVTVLIKAVGEAGDNYVANVKRFSVKAENGDTFKMVAKIAPSNEFMRAAMYVELMFKNEHIMYTDFLARAAELQDKAEVPKADRFRFPICYGSLSEPPHEMILLEDLEEANYKMLDRFANLSSECIKMALNRFAALHAMSYALKKEDPHAYDAIRSGLVDTWSTANLIEESKQFFLMMENNAIAMLDEDEYKNKMRNTVSDVTNVASKLYKSDFGSKYSVVHHGDSWTNNMMFKFEGDKPSELVLIDYQLSKENCPVYDIHYTIFNCTDHATRIKHYNEWLDYYHQELDKQLAYYGLKSSLVYPRDQLDADMRRYAKLGFGLAIVLANVLTKKSQEAAAFRDAFKTENVSELSEAFATTSIGNDTLLLLKTRIKGLIDSFTELGLMFK